VDLHASEGPFPLPGAGGRNRHAIRIVGGMAARAVWKGHVSFGLVNIPVSLYAAEHRQTLQFHLLDSRDQRRVRYERVNEETGEEVPWDQIVKGFEYEDGLYVLLSAEEMETAAGKVAKVIEIEDFVAVEEIDPVFFDKPYYLEPGKGGRKSYALLRETLRQAGKVAVAQVAIRTREHLACLMVRGECLVLELIRFPQELRGHDFLDLPSTKDVKISKREVDLALQLIENMTSAWSPDRYHDEYRQNLMKFIEEKVARGELSAGAPPVESEEGEEAGEVVDLMEYLRKSLDKRGKGKGGAEGSGTSRAPAKKTTRKKASNPGARPSASSKKRATGPKKAPKAKKKTARKAAGARKSA
jgi:DNA end-binding protein Ku